MLPTGLCLSGWNLEVAWACQQVSSLCMPTRNKNVCLLHAQDPYVCQHGTHRPMCLLACLVSLCIRRSWPTYDIEKFKQYLFRWHFIYLKLQIYQQNWKYSYTKGITKMDKTFAIKDVITFHMPN